MTQTQIKLDKSDDSPLFVISSRDLINVPMTSISNRDVVPLGSRMDGLEKTVASLVKSIEDLKNNQAKEVPNIVIDQEVQPSFSAVAATAASNVAKNRVVSTKVGGNNRYNSEYPEMDQPRGRLPSKRKNEEGDDNDGFQYPKRRPRKINYGKSNITVAGAEAAPYEVFIGNTNPATTEDIIKEVLVKVSENLPAEQKLVEHLEILDVKCMTKPRDDGYPLRTKGWKVTVPNRLREYMMKDEAYPCGWSHRRFFPKRNQPAVPGVDPTARGGAKKIHLDSAAGRSNSE